MRALQVAGASPSYLEDVSLTQGAELAVVPRDLLHAYYGTQVRAYQGPCSSATVWCVRAEVHVRMWGSSVCVCKCACLIAEGEGANACTQLCRGWQSREVGQHRVHPGPALVCLPARTKLLHRTGSILLPAPIHT